MFWPDTDGNVGRCPSAGWLPIFERRKAARAPPIEIRIGVTTERLHSVGCAHIGEKKLRRLMRRVTCGQVTRDARRKRFVADLTQKSETARVELRPSDSKSKWAKQLHYRCKWRILGRSKESGQVNFVIRTSNQPGDEATTERQRRGDCFSSRLDVQTLKLSPEHFQ